MNETDELKSCNKLAFFFILMGICRSMSISAIQLTSILRLNGNDPLPLWTEALCSFGLDLKLVGDILNQVWDGQTRLCTVAIYLEGPNIS